MMRLLPVLMLVLAAGACATDTAAPQARGATLAGTVAACPPGAGWNDPAPPRRVHGDTWYVGTCGVSAVLVTSPVGHVLLDGATEAAAPLIAANIRALGFSLADVRYILNSHEHLDHAGGIARLARESGAQVMAGVAAVPTLLRGASDRSDPQFLSLGGFPAVSSAVPVSDGQQLRLGPTRLTAHATPGHAPGGTSWTWRSCAQERCLDIVYADSLTAVSDEEFRYSDEDAHPGVLAGFRRSIDKVAGLPCDILLTTHPAASHVLQRLDADAIVEPGACRDYAGRARAALEARLAQERKDTGT